MDVKFDKTGSIETRTIEECSELIHVLCKAERFGWTNYHPEDEYQVPNYQLAINEINDLDRRLLELKIKLMEFGPSTPISQPQENLADSSQAVQQLKAEIAKKLQWYKQQQCDGGLEVDIPSVIDDLKQLAAIE